MAITVPSGGTSRRQGGGQGEENQPPYLPHIERQDDRDQAGIDHVDDQHHRNVLIKGLDLRGVNPACDANLFHVASLWLCSGGRPL
jgi:hypothetical protein